MFAEIAHTDGFQLVDRTLDPGEVRLPDRHAGGLEDVAVSLLALAHLRLCAFALGDVLDDAEHARRPRLVSPDVALAVYDPHLAVRPRHAVLHVVARAAALRLGRRPAHHLPVFRVDETPPVARVEGAFPRYQPEDPAGFVRPGDAVRLQIAFPVAEVRDALGFFQSGLALAQITKDQQGGQSIGEPPADLLEKPLLLGRPDPRVGALVQPEHVGPIPLRVHRDRDLRPYTVARRHLYRHRTIRTGTESHRPAARPCDSEHLGDTRVHRHVPEREGTGELRPGVLHAHAP